MGSCVKKMCMRSLCDEIKIDGNKVFHVCAFTVIHFFFKTS